MDVSDMFAFMSNRKHWDVERPANGKEIALRQFGFLTGFEVRFKEPLPNMDAASCYRVTIDVIAPDGSRPHFDLIIESREVKYASEMVAHG